MNRFNDYQSDKSTRKPSTQLPTLPSDQIATPLSEAIKKNFQPGFQQKQQRQQQPENKQADEQPQNPTKQQQSVKPAASSNNQSQQKPSTKK